MEKLSPEKQNEINNNSDNDNEQNIDNIIGIYQPPYESDDNLQYFFIYIQNMQKKNKKFTFNLIYDNKQKVDEIETSIEVKINEEKKEILFKISYDKINSDISLEVYIAQYSFEKKYFLKKAQAKNKISTENSKNEFLYDSLFYKSEDDFPLIYRIKFSSLLETPKKSKYSIKSFTQSTSSPMKQGISNEGNTCYMNTIIQSIYNLPFLRKEIFNLKTTVNIVILIIQRIFYNLSHATTPIKITDIFKALKWERAYWNAPQDATEIYMILYDIISSENEKIKDHCEGEMKTIIECPARNFKSERKERFLFLSLDITEKDSSISDLLENFFSKEELTGDNRYQYENEDKTFIYVDALKSYKISKPPPIFYIQLKRFNASYEKNCKEISFESSLDLSKYVDSSEKNFHYELYCVIVHDGNIDRGHYFAIINEFKQGKWFKMNDKSITSVRLKDVYTSNFGGKHITIEVNDEKKELETKYENNEKTAYILIYILKDKVSELFEDFNIIDSENDRINEKIKEYEKAENISGLDSFSNSKSNENNNSNSSGFYLFDKASELIKKQSPPENHLISSFVNIKRCSIKSSKTLTINNSGSKSYNSTQFSKEKTQKMFIHSKHRKNTNLVGFPLSSSISPSKYVVQFHFIDNEKNREIALIKVDLESNIKKLTSLGLLNKCYQKLTSNDIELQNVKLILLNSFGIFMRMIKEEENIINLLKDHLAKKIILVFYVFIFDSIYRINNETSSIITVNFYKKGFYELINKDNIVPDENGIIYSFYPLLIISKDKLPKNKEVEKMIINKVNTIFKEEIDTKKLICFENDFNSNDENLNLYMVETSNDSFATLNTINNLKVHRLKQMDRLTLHMISNKEDPGISKIFRVICKVNEYENSDLNVQKEEKNTTI